MSIPLLMMLNPSKLRGEACVSKLSFLCVLLFLLMLPCTVMGAQIYAPSDVPNVQLADSTRFVSDPEHMLSTVALRQGDNILRTIRHTTSAEGVAVIVPSIGDLTPTEFCEKIFSSWKIGKSDKDNGFILLIAVDDRQAWIQTGYGLEGVLPDARCSEILRHSLVPSMKDGDIDSALTRTLQSIGDVLSDPEASEEIRSNRPDDAAGIDSEALRKAWGYMLQLLFVLADIFVIVYMIAAGKKKPGISRHQRAVQFGKVKMWTAAAAGILSGIYLVTLLAASSSMGDSLALIGLYLGVLWVLFGICSLIYNRLRYHGHKCSRCGSSMRLVKGSDRMKILDDARQLEEKLHTVDYDVWNCPECGLTETDAFPRNQSKYTRCPSCGTVAMTATADRVLVPPTTRREGVAERVNTCLYCHHHHNDQYRLPRKTSAADAALVAGILGAGLGRRHGGGGGFGGGGFGGGGFGGGSTGGGGGGASW